MLTAVGQMVGVAFLGAVVGAELNGTLGMALGIGLGVVSGGLTLAATHGAPKVRARSRRA